MNCFSLNLDLVFDVSSHIIWPGNVVIRRAAMLTFGPITNVMDREREKLRTINYRNLK